MEYQAIILAGGVGKRIAPLGRNNPKCMFEIMDKPLIQYVVENLTTVGINDLVIVTGPNQDQIHEHFGNGAAFGVKLQYAIQNEPLGQANAIQAAESFVSKPFFVLNANDIFEPQLLRDVITHADESQAELVLVGRVVAEPWRFGVLRFDNANRLIGVIEKPPQGEEPSNIGVVGVYYFSPAIFDCIRATSLGTDDQLERAYQMLINQGKGSYVKYEGIFESLKFPWNLLSISDLLLTQNIDAQYIDSTARISDHAIIEGNVYIDKNVRVFENAVIRGPAYVGSGTVIGNHALVWGGCSFGQNCVIGGGSEIKHVVFGNNVWTHRNYVGDSIVSDNCSFGAGTITANYRFDEEDIQVRVGEQRISTGTDKLGVIMAENCRTGSNSVLMPGLKVGPNSIVGPGVTLLHDLPENMVALLSSENYKILKNKLDLTEKTRDEQMKRLDNA